MVLELQPAAWTWMKKNIVWKLITWEINDFVMHQYREIQEKTTVQSELSIEKLYGPHKHACKLQAWKGQEGACPSYTLNNYPKDNRETADNVRSSLCMINTSCSTQVTPWFPRAPVCKVTCPMRFCSVLYMASYHTWWNHEHHHCEQLRRLRWCWVESMGNTAASVFSFVLMKTVAVVYPLSTYFNHFLKCSYCL